MLIASDSKRTLLRCGPLTAERITRTVPNARAYMTRHGYMIVVIPRSRHVALGVLLMVVGCITPLLSVNYLL